MKGFEKNRIFGVSEGSGMEEFRVWDFGSRV